MRRETIRQLGEVVQFAGVGAFLFGAVLSIHHLAIALFIIGGTLAFFIGKELKKTN